MMRSATAMTLANTGALARMLAPPPRVDVFSVDVGEQGQRPNPFLVYPDSAGLLLNLKRQGHDIAGLSDAQIRDLASDYVDVGDYRIGEYEIGQLARALQDQGVQQALARVLPNLRQPAPAPAPANAAGPSVGPGLLGGVNLSGGTVYPVRDAGPGEFRGTVLPIRANVAIGASVVIIVQPQWVFRGERMVAADAETRTNFLIDDVTVGSDSQLPVKGVAMPAAGFDPAGYPVPWIWDTCQISQQITFGVTNTDGAAAHDASFIVYGSAAK